jgi:hypothetical protein
MKEVTKVISRATDRLSALASLMIRGRLEVQAREVREVVGTLRGVMDHLEGEADLPEPPSPEISPDPLVEEGHKASPPQQDPERLGEGGRPLGEDKRPKKTPEPIVTYPKCRCGHTAERHHAAGCHDCNCEGYTTPQPQGGILPAEREAAGPDGPG